MVFCYILREEAEAASNGILKPLTVKCIYCYIGVIFCLGGELDAVLNEVFQHDGPVFIDVVSESEVADLPPVFHGKKPLLCRCLQGLTLETFWGE